MILNTNQKWPIESRHHLIQRLATAFALGDTTHIMAKITDDIIWDIVGNTQLKGKDAFNKALQKMSKNEVSELSIDHILIDGDKCAVNGDIIMNEGQTYEFADFYTFAPNANKIQSIQSYVLKMH